MNHKSVTALKAAFPHTVPVLTGYLFAGVAFGILLTSKGYHAGWAVLMSTVVFAGSMQFVAVGLLTAPFDLVAAAVLTLSVNARHLFYGLSMLEKFHGMGAKKPYLIFSLSDETYSLLCSAKPPKDTDSHLFYLFIALLDHLYWIAGSALGALAGSFLTFNSKGIDFVMTALFVVIFVEQWESQKRHLSAVTGLIVTVLCLLLFGTSRFIIASMVGILVVLTMLRGRIPGDEERNTDTEALAAAHSESQEAEKEAAQ